MAAVKQRIRVKAQSRTFRADAAVISPPLPGLSPRTIRWTPSFGGPNAMQDWELASTRARSRDEVRRNGLADAGVQMLVSNIVGSGIKPQFVTSDSAFNRQLADLWLEWTDESDADGRLDFYGQQALAVASMVEGGDVFGRLRVRQLSDVATVPLRIQIIEAEYCPETKNQVGAEGTNGAAGLNPIRAGVEFDLIGRRVAYHLTREHPLDGILLGGIYNLTTVRVPASEVVHLASVRRPGMVRGEPWLTRAIAKLHDLDAYDDAQLVRQKIAALFAGFIRTDPAEAAGDEGEIFAGEGLPDDEGLSLAPLEPGTMQKLLQGETMEWSAPPSPGDSYEAFTREQKRGAATAIGLMYEQLSGDYSKVNDRTFRASVNEFRRRCAMWQYNLVVFQFCRPILRRWVELGVLSGRIVLPSGVTIAQAARARWVPEGWAYINPVQDVQAKTDEIRAGLKSRSATVSASGEDVEQIDTEQAADNTRADNLGLVHDSDLPERGALFAFGEAGHLAMLGVVQNVEPTEDGCGRLTIINYAGDVIFPALADLVVPPYNSRIGTELPDDTRPPPVPAIEAVNSSDDVYEEDETIPDSPRRVRVPPSTRSV